MSLSDEYQKFWKKLSKEQRASLEATGFDPTKPSVHGVPLAHRYYGSEPTNDHDKVPGSHSQGYDINYLAGKKWENERWVNDVSSEEVNERTYTKDDLLDVLRRILSVLGTNLEASCLRLAMGLPDQPSMTEVGKQHKLTRAAVSSRVKTVQRRLGLPPSIYMKSDFACAKLSKARRKKLK